VSIEISQIEIGDVESFRACLDVVARERRYLALLEALPIEQTMSFVGENVANGSAQLVARDGGRVVGWCDILPRWPQTVAHCGSVGMGVLPEYRGRGLGAKLLRECIAVATSHGITRVELETRVDNVRAIRLYERVGFKREGVRVHGMRVDGKYIDTLAMALLVEP
jgi:putative acetyltransferase